MLSEEQIDDYNFSSIDALIKNFEVEETGSSFFENALIKAKAGASLTKQIALADDSGIEIESLDGRPGIYAGRYLKQSGGGIDGVLKEMLGKTNRRCNFTCCLVMVNPSGEIIFRCEEKWFGTITNEKRGDNGFGYDPIVVPDEYLNENLTVAELEVEIKNKISHRAKALKKLISFLKSSLSFC